MSGNRYLRPQGWLTHRRTRREPAHDQPRGRGGIGISRTSGPPDHGTRMRRAGLADGSAEPTTTYGYDSNNRLTLVTDPLGISWSMDTTKRRIVSKSRSERGRMYTRTGGFADHEPGGADRAVSDAPTTEGVRTHANANTWTTIFNEFRSGASIDPLGSVSRRGYARAGNDSGGRSVGQPHDV